MSKILDNRYLLSMADTGQSPTPVGEEQFYPIRHFVHNSLKLRAMMLEITSCQITDSGMHMSMIAPDRNTGVPVVLNFTVSFEKELRPGMPLSRAAKDVILAGLVKDAIVKIVSHELSELLFINDVRASDPHGHENKNGR